MGNQASAWKRDLEGIWAGMMTGRPIADRDVILMDSTPGSLAAIGFPDLPWTHDVDHIVRELSEQDGRDDCEHHGIPKDTMLSLPELISNPIGAYVMPEYPDRVNLILDATTAIGVPVIACCAPDGRSWHKGRDIRAVRVMSVHGRNTLAGNLTSSASRDGIVSMDYERLRNLFDACGIAIPLKVLSCRPTGRITRISPKKADQDAWAKDNREENGVRYLGNSNSGLCLRVIAPGIVNKPGSTMTDDGDGTRRLTSASGTISLRIVG